VSSDKGTSGVDGVTLELRDEATSGRRPGAVATGKQGRAKAAVSRGTPKELKTGGKSRGVVPLDRRSPTLSSQREGWGS